MANVLASPRDAAPLEPIVARPGPGEREILDEAVLDEANGLVGDGWLARGSGSTPDRSANPAAQLTLMSTRVLAAIESRPVSLAACRRPAPSWTWTCRRRTCPRLAADDREGGARGDRPPAYGLRQFSARFGADSLRWISTPAGRANRMRGCTCGSCRGGPCA